jgi:valyl-tRNA synthetase
LYAADVCCHEQCFGSCRNICVSGAVKITPAHDPNDYDIGRRHSLPFITIFSDDGYIIGDYGIFSVSKLFSCLNSNENPKYV